MSLSNVMRSKRPKKVKAKSDSEEGADTPSLVALVERVLKNRARTLHFFRPSMVWGCDRANVFHYKRTPHHPSRQSPKMMRILDNGTAIHEVLQGYLSDSTEWWFAKESRVFSVVEGANIRGSCDGVLIHRKTGVRVGVEIKTIGQSAFDRLKKELPHHRKQAMIYAKLQGLNSIVILYWAKGSHDLKEFVVRPSEKEWSHFKERVRHLKMYVDSGKLPEYDSTTCDVTFCQSVDWCRKKGAPV